MQIILLIKVEPERWIVEAVSARLEYKPIWAWITVLILIFFTLVSYIDRQIISLLVEPIREDLHFNDTQISLIQGVAFALFYSFAGIPLGMAADRYSRRVLLFIGIVVFSLASAGCGLMSGFTGLFVCRMVVGIGEAVLTPVAVSIISDNFPREKLGVAMGVFGTAPSIGFGCAFMIIGALMGILNEMPRVVLPFVGEVEVWRATFILTGLPGVVLAFLAFVLHDPRAAASARIGQTTSSLPRSAAPLKVALKGRGRAVAHLLVGASLLGVTSYVVLAWTPAFFIRRHGWDVISIGLWFGAIVAISGTCGSIIFGRVMSRLQEGGRKDACFIVASATSFLGLLFFVTGYLIDHAELTLVCIAIGYFLMSALAPATYSAIPLITPRDARARVSAIYVLCVALSAVGLAPLLVAAVTDYIFQDPLRVGDSLALVLSVIVPAGCLALYTGRSELILAVDMPEAGAVER